jgi:hypothetical protein
LNAGTIPEQEIELNLRIGPKPCFSSFRTGT